MDLPDLPNMVQKTIANCEPLPGGTKEAKIHKLHGQISGRFIDHNPDNFKDPNSIILHNDIIIDYCIYIYYILLFIYI